MPLTSIGISASLTWQLERAVTGFTPVTQGTDSAAFSSNSLDTATWTEVFLAQYTLAQTASQSVDLRSFTDLAGTAVVGTKAMALIVVVTGAVTDRLNVKPDTGNPLQWFFENASYGVNIPGGGMALLSEGASSTGTAVTATSRALLLTNNGAASMTAKIVVLVSTL